MLTPEDDLAEFRRLVKQIQDKDAISECLLILRAGLKEREEENQ